MIQFRKKIDSQCPKVRFRTRKLLTSKIRRAIRWEFWPMSVFYVPIVVYILWLSLKHRGLSFLSVNPGFIMSGLVGENKAHTLKQLIGSEYLAKFDIITLAESSEQRVIHAQQFMSEQKLVYPVVLKPDFGQRGQDVAVIRSDQQLQQYLDSIKGDVLIQEHIEGEEFGVFYIRYPNEEQGEIFSITEKTFPILIGDGVSSLEKLILNHPRTHFMAHYLLELHKDTANMVLADGQKFKVVEIGSHCRGSVFLDGNKNITTELTHTLDYLSNKIEGFYFGRYDIRVPDSASLKQGHSLKVLEVNGVTSESTNIYDPSYSVIDAYKILFKQWRVAFKIGNQNIQNGVSKVSVIGFFSYLKATYFT